MDRGYAGKSGALVSLFLAVPLSPSSSFLCFKYILVKKLCIYVFIYFFSMMGGLGEELRSRPRNKAPRLLSLVWSECWMEEGKGRKLRGRVAA